MPAPDFYNLLAQSRAVPAGWRWYELQVIGDGPREHRAFTIVGAVVNGTYSKGKFKGKPKYDPATKRTIVVSFPDLDVFIAQWEVDNNTCAKCGGDGVETARVSVDGRTTQPCSGAMCKARREADEIEDDNADQAQIAGV